MKLDRRRRRQHQNGLSRTKIVRVFSPLWPPVGGMHRILFSLENFGTVDTLQLICFKHTLVGFTHYVKFLETFIEIWAFLIYIHIYMCVQHIFWTSRRRRSHQTSSKMCSKTSNYVRNNFIALGSIVHIKILNPKGIWVPKMHAHNKSCETHDFGAW